MFDTDAGLYTTFNSIFGTDKYLQFAKALDQIKIKAVPIDMDKERLKRVQKQLKQIAKKESVGLDVAKTIEAVGQTLTLFRSEVAEL